MLSAKLINYEETDKMCALSIRLFEVNFQICLAALIALVT